MTTVPVPPRPKSRYGALVDVYVRDPVVRDKALLLPPHALLDDDLIPREEVGYRLVVPRNPVTYKTDDQKQGQKEDHCRHPRTDINHVAVGLGKCELPSRNRN